MFSHAEVGIGVGDKSSHPFNGGGGMKVLPCHKVEWRRKRFSTLDFPIL